MSLFLMKSLVHYFLHFVFPLFVAKIFFKKEWKKTYILMLLTMLVDLDHLLANPIFDPNRASVGFHFLHTYPAIFVYFLLLFFKGNWRIIGVGLLLHMFTDFQDFHFWNFF